MNAAEYRATHGVAGGYLNLVSWARSPEEFREPVDIVAAENDMYVYELNDVRLVPDDKDGWPEEFEEMVKSAEEDPEAVIFGTFYQYRPDDE